MSGGWIKLYRQIQDCAIWTEKDKPFDKRSAWIDLLLMANHKDNECIFNGMPAIVHRGQLFTSYESLAKRWQWTVKAVRCYLSQLKRLEMVTLKGTPKGTLLTLEKYAFFQGEGHTEGHTEGQTEGTLGASKGQQTIIYNNDNNDKEEKERGAAFDPWGEKLQ